MLLSTDTNLVSGWRGSTPDSNRSSTPMALPRNGSMLLAASVEAMPWVTADREGAPAGGR